MRAKTCHENKLHENHANSFHTFKNWSITWSQYVVSIPNKRWLIFHSMACTAIYIAHVIARKFKWWTKPRLQKSKENQWPFFIASCQVSHCLMSTFSMLGQEFADYSSIQVHFVLTPNKMHSSNKKKPVWI